MPDHLSVTLNSIFPKDGLYTFFVGAGISMESPTNLPSAIAITKSFFEISAPPEEVDSLKSLSGIRYEKVVELSRVFNADAEYLDYFDLVKKFNVNHLFLAHCIKSGQAVMTTNFDYLIERALQQIVPVENHSNIIPVITQSDFSQYSDPFADPQNPNLFLYKIHGSQVNIISGNSTRDSVITRVSDFSKNLSSDELFQLAPYKLSAVHNLTKNRSLVVLGYSGSDDFDVTPTLQQLPALNKLIWVEHTQQGPMEIISVNSALDNNISPDLNRIPDQLKTLQKSLQHRCEFIFIRANTRDLILNHLISLMLPDLDSSTLVNLVNVFADSTEAHPSFGSWITPLFQDVSLLSKYKYAVGLYLDAWKPDLVEKCARKGLQLAEQENLPGYKPHFLTAMGDLYLRLGDSAQANSYYSQVSQDQEESDDMAVIAVKIRQAQIAMNSQQLPLAQQLLTEAQNLNQTVPYHPYSIMIHNSFGLIAYLSGIFDQALHHYQIALEITQKTGDLPSRCNILHNMATIHIAQNLIPTATLELEEAYKILQLLPNEEVYPKVLMNLGQLELAKPDIDKALKYFREALTIAEPKKDALMLTSLYNVIGALTLQQNQIDIAQPLLEKALHYAQQTKTFDIMLESTFWLGKLEDMRKNYAAALLRYQSAEVLCGQVQNPGLMVTIYETIAALYIKLEDPANSIIYFEKGLQFAQSQGMTQQVQTYEIMLKDQKKQLKKLQKKQKRKK